MAIEDDDFPEFFSRPHLASRQRLRDAGVDPYPYGFDLTHSIGEFCQGFENLEASRQEVRLAGRILSQRVMGRTSFIDLRDGMSRVQAYLRADSIGADRYRLVCRELMPGDLIGVSGSALVSRSGEQSIEVESVTVLAKAVMQVGYGKSTDDRSWYALSNIEVRRTQRYLDWLTDPQALLRFRRRFEIIAAIREHMVGNGFLEVETPTIEPVYGGAEARPFTTSIHALGGQAAYLRISPELYLKRYIVGGFTRVFSICKNFRNEGIDATHNPEFTMMEWYEAYTDYERQMERFEELVCHLVERFNGGQEVGYRGSTLSFVRPWPRYSIPSLMRERFGKELQDLTREEIADALVALAELAADDLPSTLRTTSKGALLARWAECSLAGQLVQPCFLIDHPEDISPLTKARRGMPGFVERFEPFVAGMEMGNAYSELTDPVEQFRRFRTQRELQANGEEGYENHPLDLDFVRAISCGMPPTGGVGLGIDRLIMVMLGAESIRDVVPFPMSRA